MIRRGNICRPGEPVKARSFARALFARSLERSSDAALALETRGFALARPLRVKPIPRRAVDWLVLVSASAGVALCVFGASDRLASFSGFPVTEIDQGAGDIGFALAIFVVLALPALVPRRSRR